MAGDPSHDEAYLKLHKAGNEKSRNEIATERTHDGVSHECSSLEWQSSRLCLYCQAIADGWPPFDKTYRKPWTFTHYDSVAELKKSAADGCKLCAQFSLGSNYLQSPTEHVQFMGGLVEISRCLLFETRLDGLGPCMKLLYSCVYADLARGGGERKFEHCVYAIPAQREEVKFSNFRGRELSTRDGLPLVKEWLEICCNDTLCTPHERYVPTRLIDVTSTPHLCWGSSIGKSTNYATLSHCWGSLQLPTLTKNTLEQYCIAIPASALSKTFQEAVHITRELNIRYLWIDSLCIVQDDADDWRRESALMTNVYGSATINIAASWASDGNCGCFSQRSPAWRCQFQVAQIPDNSKLKGFVECFTDEFLKELLDMPLATRGWALQERLIAPRTLFLARSQLFWQCRTIERCEIFPEGLLTPSNLCYGGKITVDIDMWWMIIFQYSRCNITYGRDKLVALSGIAKEIHRRTKDQYVAGLWRKDVERHLCWRVKWPLSAPSEYRAPTWSWASVDGKVSNSYLVPGKMYENLVRILQVHLVYKVPKNPFGEVIEGSIRLECGNLLQGTVVLLDGNRELDMRWRLRIPLYEYDEDDWVSFDHIEATGGDGETAVFVLPVISFSDDHWLHFISLLLRQTGVRPGEYKRVGCMGRTERARKSSFKDILKTDTHGWSARATQYRELFAEVNTVERDDGGLDFQKIIVLV